MPIKTDGAGKRWVEMDLLVSGTPEQVWHAMATGPGNAAWFVEGEIEPRVGGVLRLDFGHGAVTTGEVTKWDPPREFGYVEREWAEGAPPIATEITITSRSGDRCLIRMVHSLFTTSDDWDDQMEGFESGWPGFFAVLRVYLAHFAGARAASFFAMGPASGDSLSVWRRMVERLGLAGASVGEHRTAASTPEAWSGVVELVHQEAQHRYVLLRLDAPGPGIAIVGTYDKGAHTSVSVCRYFYGEDAKARAAASEPQWRAWLAETFGAEEPAPAEA